MANNIRRSDTIDNPVLIDGTATPYISLFDEYLTPILNPLTGIYLGVYVSSFTFTYQENTDSDDIGNHVTFHIDSGNPDCIDIPELQKDSLINFQYGYIYPDGSFLCGPLLSTSIYQIHAVFDEKGTHLTIIGREIGLKLRGMEPFKGFEGRSLQDYLDEGCGVDLPIIIKKFPLPV